MAVGGLTQYVVSYCKCKVGAYKTDRHFFMTTAAAINFVPRRVANTPNLQLNLNLCQNTATPVGMLTFYLLVV